MKIVYCLNSIRYLGGIQRVTIVKANALAEILENEVYIVVTDNKNGIITEPLSQKVHLIDLDINYYEDDWKSKWNVLKGIITKRKEHKKKLTKFLHQIQPDIVISVGQSEKNFIPDIKGGWRTIREFHFDKKYRQRQAQSVFDKVLAFGGDFFDSFILKKYDRVVVLTHEDKQSNWVAFKNVTVIPNPVTIVSSETSNCNNKKIISVGRLQFPKNYESLIHAFKYVTEKHPDWTLEIWGDGSERNKLYRQINTLHLTEKVHLCGLTTDVTEKLKDASIFALSSVFEGFGLVIIEAMKMGLPVVSYDCPYGPRDIITENVDGYLVEVNDEKNMAEKICTLIENEEKRQIMGKAASKKAEMYSLPKILDLWNFLFQELTNK